MVLLSTIWSISLVHNMICMWSTIIDEKKFDLYPSYISNKWFVGPIPSTIGNLSNLDSINLSSNKLNGEPHSPLELDIH